MYLVAISSNVFTDLICTIFLPIAFFKKSVPKFGCQSKLTDLRYVANRRNLDITCIAVKNSDISNI